MNRIQTIKAELALDHEITGAYDADDKVAAGQLNAENIPVIGSIPSNEILAWAAGGSPTPRLHKLEEASANHASPTVEAIADVAIMMIRRDNTELDLSLPDRVAMVDALVTGGVLDNDDKDTLYALATTLVSRASQLGVGKVKPGHVEEARR